MFNKFKKKSVEKVMLTSFNFCFRLCQSCNVLTTPTSTIVDTSLVRPLNLVLKGYNLCLLTKQIQRRKLGGLRRLRTRLRKPTQSLKRRFGYKSATGTDLMISSIIRNVKKLQNGLQTQRASQLRI